MFFNKQVIRFAICPMAINGLYRTQLLITIRTANCHDDTSHLYPKTGALFKTGGERDHPPPPFFTSGFTDVFPGSCTFLALGFTGHPHFVRRENRLLTTGISGLDCCGGVVAVPDSPSGPRILRCGSPLMRTRWAAINSPCRGSGALSRVSGAGFATAPVPDCSGFDTVAAGSEPSVPADAARLGTLQQYNNVGSLSGSGFTHRYVSMLSVGISFILILLAGAAGLCTGDMCTEVPLTDTPACGFAPGFYDDTIDAELGELLPANLAVGRHLTKRE